MLQEDAEAGLEPADLQPASWDVRLGSLSTQLPPRPQTELPEPSLQDAVDVKAPFPFQWMS